MGAIEVLLSDILLAAGIPKPTFTFALHLNFRGTTAPRRSGISSLSTVNNSSWQWSASRR